MRTTIEKSIFLDYSRGVYRKIARHVPITVTERAGLEVGHHVTVTGDDVPVRHAVVEDIDDNARGAFQAAEISIRFID